MAIKAIITVHGFKFVGTDLTADVEVEGLNGVHQRTTLSTNAAALSSTQVAAGIKNLLITYVQNAPEYGQTLLATEILYNGTPG